VSGPHEKRPTPSGGTLAQLRVGVPRVALFASSQRLFSDDGVHRPQIPALPFLISLQKSSK
jgi:hypothetical protein